MPTTHAALPTHRIVGPLALAFAVACSEPVIVLPKPKEPECSAAKPCPTGFCINSECKECELTTDCIGANAGKVCSPTTHTCIDPNMGGCNVANCPVPAHAAAACVNGSCGRGSCEATFFDFDPAAPGCETSCAGNVCTLGNGTTVTLTAPPVHERAPITTAVSGGAHGDKVQTSATHTNVGHLGESTPGGSVEQTGGTYKHVGGFNAVLNKR